MTRIVRPVIASLTLVVALIWAGATAAFAYTPTPDGGGFYDASPAGATVSSVSTTASTLPWLATGVALALVIVAVIAMSATLVRRHGGSGHQVSAS